MFSVVGRVCVVCVFYFVRILLCSVGSFFGLYVCVWCASLLLCMCCCVVSVLLSVFGCVVCVSYFVRMMLCCVRSSFGLWVRVRL